MPYQFQFADNKKYPFQSGGIYLGVDQQTGKEVGINSEKHGLVVGASGAGKSSAILIPNLFRWPHSSLVIDIKGELARETAHKRAAMGQSVYVVDPFQRSKVDSQYLAKYNPLDELDINSPYIGEDILVIADGIVKRHDPRHARWDDNAVSILAGMIAFAKTNLPPEEQNLIEIRDVLLTQDMKEIALNLAEFPQCGKLMQRASRVILGDDGEAFLQTARDNTTWLDSQGIIDTMSSSTFSLSDLKRKNATIYLVIPPDYLTIQGSFLKIFVRCGISQMLKLMPDGSERGNQCLFLLDEFYSLGKIEAIATGFGQFRSIGLQLIPFLQDLGQLHQLYGQDGSTTFFGNSDAQVFFGNTDPTTLNHISNYAGKISAHEVEAPPEKTIRKKTLGERLRQPLDGSPDNEKEQREGRKKDREHNIEQENKQRQYQFETSVVGSPRLPPDKIRSLVMKGDNDPVARSMIVFAKGSDVLNVKLAPYFLNKKTNILNTNTPNSATPERKGIFTQIWDILGALALGSVSILFLIFPLTYILGQNSKIIDAAKYLFLFLVIYVIYFTRKELKDWTPLEVIVARSTVVYAVASYASVAIKHYEWF